MRRDLKPGPGREAALVACLHLRPLPGSPRWEGDLDSVVERALAEARLYAGAGVDGMILENTHDVPYENRGPGPATVAAMARAAAEVRRVYSGPLGIQVLAGANRAALEIAVAADLDFIRAEGFVYGHVADEGWIDADAPALLRRRAELDANHVEVWADVKKKHASHAVTADLSLRETAEGAVFFDVDGIVITGSATGRATSLDDVRAVRDLPVRTVVGSGVDTENARALAKAADVLIVGSSLKTGGDWRGEVERERVEALLRTLDD
jgi:hypothetical protein